MTDMKLSLVGEERLLKALRDPNFIKGPLRDFLERASSHVELDAKQRAPVDTGRLRNSIAHRVETYRAFVGSNVQYACVVGARAQVYDPLSKLSSGIGRLNFDMVLSKDGTPHNIAAKHVFYRPEIDAVTIRTRLGRNPLTVTADHLMLCWRDGQVVWQRADGLRSTDMLFGKRSHNAITDASDKIPFLCFCGDIFWVNKHDTRFRQVKYCSQACRHKFGPHNQNEGMHWNLSEQAKLKHRGSNNPQWRDGSARKPYDYGFNAKIRATVKERDGYQCQYCESPFDLVVHHVDWDKMNSRIENLITLCRPCHGQLNRQDCEMPDVNMMAFAPRPILSLEQTTIRRKGKANVPRLYDLTVERENSFLVGGLLVHNSFVEFGSRPHFPPLSAMQPWARRHGFPAGNKGAFLVARAIARRGTKPKPFLIPALRGNERVIMRYLDQAVRSIEAKWGQNG